MNSYTNYNVSYLGNYKVFCFSDIELPRYSAKESSIVYKIDDLIPIYGYNYAYNNNLLVIDYVNKLIHIIVNHRYCETIKMKDNVLNIYEDSYLFKLNLDIKVFLSMDIYGNLLDVNTIEEIIMSIMEFPNLESYFIYDKYTNVLKNNELLLTDINYNKYSNRISMLGVCKYDNDLLKNNKLIDDFTESIYRDSISIFNNRWFLNNDNLNMINELLLNIRLLYLVNLQNIRIPFSYYMNNKKYVTHIGKIDNNIKKILCDNEKEVIEELIDFIFQKIEYNEDYQEFVISTLSTYTDDKFC